MTERGVPRIDARALPNGVAVRPRRAHGSSRSRVIVEHGSEERLEVFERVMVQRHPAHRRHGSRNVRRCIMGDECAARQGVEQSAPSRVRLRV